IDGKNIASIENSSQTLQSYLNMLSTYTGLIWVMNILAIIVAFAIIYNTSVISLSEREREFATLRVLGLQIKEVSEIMSFEYWVLCFFGIILGFPFNDFLKLQMSNMIEVEMFSIPTYTPPEAYVNAIVGCIAAVFISNFTASRNIKKFDMVEVLKERE
ncbi:MAG: ABC transporter permease, partial [Clostridiales bacterium]|nr:ABC transporter permease [Clostridiales bacterium]